jgi:hypothetical protein
MIDAFLDDVRRKPMLAMPMTTLRRMSRIVKGATAPARLPEKFHTPLPPAHPA